MPNDREQAELAGHVAAVQIARVAQWLALAFAAYLLLRHGIAAALCGMGAYVIARLIEPPPRDTLDRYTGRGR